jgi:hypothetical protein
MLISSDVMIEVLKTVVTISILFVWFVRYENIKTEFKQYGYPSWFRDLIGILKISFTVMLHSNSVGVVNIGSLGILLLMIGAVYTHFRVNNSFEKYLASLAMLIICSIIIYLNIL